MTWKITEKINLQNFYTDFDRIIILSRALKFILYYLVYTYIHSRRFIHRDGSFEYKINKDIDESQFYSSRWYISTDSVQ